MKTIISLFLIISITACTMQNNTNAQINNIGENRSAAKLEKIELKEQTRGTNRIFIFSKGKLKSSINGNTINHEITLSDWSKILDNAENINLEEISKLEAPSTKRYSDAALASTIAITKNGLDYKSSDFDSGNPPLELKNLYNEIQKIIESKKSK